MVWQGKYLGVKTLHVAYHLVLTSERHDDGLFVLGFFHSLHLVFCVIIQVKPL